MDFYSRNNLLPLNECFPFSRAVEPWVFHVQGLGSGGVWEIACTPCSRVKNKNKSAFSQTEKSHQHPETDRDGPKEQAPSCAALLGGKGGWCCCPTPAVISWLAGGGRKHFADEAAFLWQKIIPQSWYQLHLVKLLLVFISPSPALSFSACHPWHCNVRMTHQAQRYLEMADSGCA